MSDTKTVDNPATTEQATGIIDKQKIPWLFTKETAGEMARRANKIRWEEQKAKDQEREKLLQTVATFATTQQAPAIPNGQDSYVHERLARTREHIAKADAALDAAILPKDREACARALAQLMEQERILAGRPLPGSHRPTASRSRGQAQSIEPV